MARDEVETVTGTPAVAALRRPGGVLVSGQVLADRYTIVAELGRGGSGVVYQAFDQHARVQVALKALDTPDWLGQESTEQLFRELRFGRSLQHPNVCRIHD